MELASPSSETAGSEEDFQDVQNLNSNIDKAIAGLESLEGFTQPRKRQKKATKKKTQKRGPKLTSVSNYWYFLPSGSPIPQLRKKESELQKTHQEAGYGYPRSSYDQIKNQYEKIKFDPNMTADEFHQKIRELFPVLGTKNFKIFKIDRQRKLILLVPQHPSSLCLNTSKDRYRGTVFLKVVEEAERSAGQSSQPPQQQLAQTLPELPPPPQQQLAHSQPPQQQTPPPQLQQPRSQPSQQQPPLPQELQSDPEHIGDTTLDADGLPTMVRYQRNRLSRRRQNDVDGNFASLDSPEIYARRILIHEQDAEFNQSLMADRQKEEDSLQARAIRQRLRQQRREVREQERAQKEKEVGEEPPPTASGVINLNFRFNAGENVKRRFIGNSPIKIVFLWLEAHTGIRQCKLVCPQGKVLERTEKHIIEELEGNTTISVEKLEDDDSSEDDDEDGENDTAVCIEDTIPVDLDELKRRRSRIADQLLETIKIKVKRSDIVNTVLTAYRLHLHLEHHNIEVELDGEMGVDLTGVTKEMYHLFFTRLWESHFEGDIEKVPCDDHRYYTTDLYRTLGRIIVHAFIITGYWPYQLCTATAVAALTCSVSTELAAKSFLQVISHNERTAIKALMHGASYNRLLLINVLSRYNCREDVNATNADKVIRSIASAVTVYRIYFAIMQMSQGLRSYTLLWKDISEDVIVELYNSLVCNVSEILKRLKPTYTDDVLQRTLEERVVCYLEEWLGAITAEQLQSVLIFWTASNVLLHDDLHIEFNGVEGLSRRPTAVTCSNTLNLSRCYFGKEDLFKDLRIMYSKEAEILDAS